jgi:TolA-binding protein
MEAAASRLAQARDVASLQSIITDFRGHPASAEAMMRLADLHYQEEQYDQAADVYRQFMQSFPRHPFRESALLGLAAVEETRGNLTTAKAEYERLLTAHPNGYTAMSARMGMARCAEALGQKKEARQLYEELVGVARGTAGGNAAYLRWVVLGRDQAVTAPLPSPSGAGAPETAENAQKTPENVTPNTP